MELLWNVDTFSASLKQHLGFVDADIRFSRIESPLRNATAEIIDLIGDENYNNLHNKESEFARLVQYAILLKAIIIYAPTADLAFTNRGRKLRTDEHDGTPWQWMLDANDRALNNLYYRHLDLLLKHMFRNNIPVNIEKYNFQNLLVNSLDVFENHFNICGSFYLYLKLIPALRECEELELTPRIGHILKPDFSALMKNLSQKACVFYALQWGLKRLNIQIFPEGVFQESWNTGGKSQSSSKKLEYLETAMVMEADFRKYITALEAQVHKLEAVKDPFADRLVFNPGFSMDDGFIDT